MTKQVINVGTAANDKKGDSLRAAFQKVNANFTELYTALGIAADADLNLGNFVFESNTVRLTNANNDDSTATQIEIAQPVRIESDLTVGGDVVPNTANGGDLGSAAKPWRSLYVSNNTIYIGGTAVGVDANGQLTVSGSQVNAPSSTLVNGAKTVSLDANGNITFPQGTLLGYSDPGGFIIDGAVDKDIAIYTYNGADAHGWTFGTDGDLTLPEGGDILNSNGDSVLGGGSYTPDDADNWDGPTVNTVAAALDELAARMTAFENFEIDGGNAYTPAAGELIIDGNGA